MSGCRVGCVIGVGVLITGFVLSGEGAVLTAELSGLLVVATLVFEPPPVFELVFVLDCSGVCSGVGVAETDGAGVGVATFVAPGSVG